MLTSLVLAASLVGTPLLASRDASVPKPAPAPSSVPSVVPATGFEERMVAFGLTVAISGDQAFVGEPRGGSAQLLDAGGAAPGHVHVYRRGPNGWRRVGNLFASDSAPGDGFGATIAADERSLLIARIGFGDDADSTRGSVHTFRKRADGTWERTGTVRAPVPAVRAAFGASLLLAGDVAYVGAPSEGGGAVHMLRRNADGSWSVSGAVAAPTLAATDRFGAAIATDGARLAVGTPGRTTNRGAVVMYSRAANGSWTADTTITFSRATDQSRFGASLLLKGDRLIVGAPGALPLNNPGGPSAGLVAVLEYSRVTEIWRERQTFTSFLNASSRFGQTMAMVGTELWVGAPASTRNTGHVFRLRQGADGVWGSMRMLDAGTIEGGSQFAAAMAASSDAVIVGMPQDAGGEGSVMFFSRTVAGEWTTRGAVFPSPEPNPLKAVTGKELECPTSGKVSAFECQGTALSSFLPLAAIGGRRGTTLNDNWGWTDPVTKREIALIGRSDGTSFVDVSDAANPRYLGDLPKTKGQPSAAWRDMKVYKDHVYIVADNSGEHGVQVFDLTRLRTVRTPQVFTPDLTYDRINSAHNIVSNIESGFMYVVGGSGGGETCGGGYHMIDVREPKKPKFAGCFGDPKTGLAGTGYSHDAQCVMYRGPDTKYKGREICIGSNETMISIADLTDKKAPVAISRASYPNNAYAHQAWLTDDHRYLYLNDEGDESQGAGEAAKGTRTLVWDLADLSDPILVKEFVGNTRAIDHNLYVVGDRMYQANYNAGMRTIDISDPRNPKEVGYIDTTPGGNNLPAFIGVWSIYPFFDSGTIIVTSIGEGVFFVKDRTKRVVQ
ncbi:MAG: choice-of-anchor B family protein [Gemmatimonadaceae bacterium]